ncbi:50S ribosomal protein L15e [Candidatus Woesearchaeota archaeon]|nr:50S ribosomal protein L15e [Candidatus Woesearchaeota archaeon]
MGMYKYIRNLWKNPQASMPELWKQRLMQWRREPTTIRIEHPTRLDRAHTLGYKAKHGFLMVRQRVDRGGRMRPNITGGRRSKHSRQRKIVNLNYQNIAEQRAARKFTNCEVMNSYPVGQDGNYYWFEIILVDRTHPEILADKDVNWISLEKGRVFRGLTAAAKHSRGLYRKGTGAEKIRPSQRANLRKAH